MHINTTSFSPKWSFPPPIYHKKTTYLLLFAAVVCNMLMNPVTSFISNSRRVFTPKISMRGGKRALSPFPGGESRQTNGDKYIAKHRFWLQSFDFQLSNDSLTHEQVVEELYQAMRPIKSGYVTQQTDGQPVRLLTVPKSDFGLILAPQLQLLVPLHDGIVQKQHAMRLPNSFFSGSLISENTSSTVKSLSAGVLRLSVCGFSRRAEHHISTDNDASNLTEYSDSSEEEGFEITGSVVQRPVDPARLAALTLALPMHCQDLTLDSLLGEEDFQGTPPARIARSFICPRKNRSYLPVPIERAAKTTAEQISLAVRRLRADRLASVLRNIDKPTPLLDSDQSTSRKKSSEHRPHAVMLVLDNLRSAFNVGSLFRTAETAGLAGIITCGITPHPPYHEKLRKTGFQAIDTVPTQHFDDVVTALESLREKNYKIVALETTNTAKQYDRIDYNQQLPLAIVVGNEVCGVDTRVLQTADAVAEIPTFGQKNSLNVAAAAPIMIFEVLRQLHCREPDRQAQPTISSAHTPS